MCEFISWKEVGCPDGGKEILFLTYNDVYNTKRGRELREYTSLVSDCLGHGAIAYYFEIAPEKGSDHECTYFGESADFPPVIVEAIKAGKFAGLPIRIFPVGLLSAELYAAYMDKRNASIREYEKKVDEYYSVFKLIEEPLFMQHRARADAIVDEFKVLLDDLSCRYSETKPSAETVLDEAEYRSAWELLQKQQRRRTELSYAEYDKLKQPAYAAYKAAHAENYAELIKRPDELILEQWKLFADVDNRAEAWK